MRSTLENILKALECESGSILLYDPRTEELSLTEIIGVSGSSLAGQRQEVSRGIAGWVATNHEPLLIEDITTDERFAGLRNTARSYKTNSFASTPLLDGDKLIGVVNVSDKRSGGAFGINDLHMLQAFGERIAKPIRDGMSFRKLSERGLTLSEKVEEAARQLVNANLELAQMQGFHDGVLRSISLGLLTFDRSLRLTFYNEAAREVFGFTNDDLGRTSLLKLKIEPKGKQAWAEVLEACVTEHKTTTLRRAACRSPGGKQLLLDVTCSPLDKSAGELGGTLVVEDVRRSIQVEQRLAEAEQLATIGKLAASVAHELNNPLDGILRFTKMAIRQNNSNEKVLDYLGECDIGLKRMSKIVRSLLDYSRVIGKGLEDLDVNEMITSAIRSLRHLQIRNNIAVNNNFSEHIPQARFTNFSEVFSNIIRNAYEAMPLGGNLTITTAMEESAVKVRFEDTGLGMSSDVVGRVFEPFFTTKNSAECTGLGLAVCSDIVSKHGGSIHVESKRGRGSVFEVRVPL